MSTKKLLDSLANYDFQLAERMAQLIEPNDVIAGVPVAHHCAQAGAIDALTTLLNRGANADALDLHNNTLAHAACKGGHRQTIIAAIERSNYRGETNVRGETAQDLAPNRKLAQKAISEGVGNRVVAHTRSGNVEALEADLTAFAPALPDARMPWNGTLAHVAVKSDNPVPVLEVLRRHSQPLDNMDWLGATPMRYAAAAKKEQAVGFLVESGVALKPCDERMLGHSGPSQGMTR